MEVAALGLLLCFVVNCVDSVRAQVSAIVIPNRSQYFKYDSFSVSCKEDEEASTGWRVMQRTTDGEVLPCASPCFIEAAFPSTDSGQYWCETTPGATSNAVNITITTGDVILESPAFPVTEGDDVNLRCTGRGAMSAGDLAAEFYKDGRLIAASSTGNVTVYKISKSDEGLYKCKIPGAGDSPDSWLTLTETTPTASVRPTDPGPTDAASSSTAPSTPPPTHPMTTTTTEPAPPPTEEGAPPTVQDPAAPAPPVFTVLHHVLVGSPYLVSTVMLVLVCRDRRRALQANEAKRPSDEIIMQIAN